jgi:phosphatidyl-myo-inositol alpha-mannosyltransferase
MNGRKSSGMRIGIVCPYDWQTPGGVQGHVHQLALSLLERGHQVRVLAPADEDSDDLPRWLDPAGRGLPVRFNGSVARVRITPGTGVRTRNWVRGGDFDVIHVHEPLTPGLSLVVSRMTSVPVVGTFHAAAEQGIAMSLASTLLGNVIVRLDKRIVVSAAARETLMGLVDDGDVEAVEIPNFIDTRGLLEAPVIDSLRGPDGTIVFLGRTDESRKGLDVLLEAVPLLLEKRPNLRIVIAGPGDIEEVRSTVDWAHRHNVVVLGEVDEATKRSLFTTADIYVAPNLGGESFGIVLLEAMAAGTPVVASDLDAFSSVLEGGASGRLFPRGDAHALADNILALLTDEVELDRLRQAGLRRASEFDRERVVDRIEDVYKSMIGPAHLDHVHAVALTRRARIAARAAARVRA